MVVYQEYKNGSPASKYDSELNIWRSGNSTKNLFNFFESLSAVLLPVGYPHSVKPEYISFQFWDSLQGLASYLRGCLTTHALLVGAGVGNQKASVTSASLTWIFKDGLGMLTSLILAYGFSVDFSVNSKEWRFFADFLNNVGLLLNMIIALYPQYFLLLVSLSSMCFAACGLIAGATRVHISSHFVSSSGHLSDITTKESTQETFVTLIGLLLGMLLTSLIEGGYIAWICFLLLTVFHQWCNYKLVRVLVFDNLNPQRCYLLCKALFLAERTGISVSLYDDLTPNGLNSQENFIIPLYLHWNGPKFGVSLREICSTLAFIDYHLLLDDISNSWQKEGFVLAISSDLRVLVALEQGTTPYQALKAYCIALYVQEYIALSDNVDGKLLKRMYDDIISGVLCKKCLFWFDNYVQPFLVCNGKRANTRKTKRSLSPQTSKIDPLLVSYMWECDSAVISDCQFRYSCCK